MDIVQNRRDRLRAWIDENCNGSQAQFVTVTGINQGELSGLLRQKSFGEKKARSLELAAGMPLGWLDVVSSAPEVEVPPPLTQQYYIQASSPEDLAVKLAEKGNEEIARIIQLLLTHKDKIDGR